MAVRYFLRWGAKDRAELAALGAAGAADPDDADLLLAGADAARARGDTASARRRLTRGADRFPTNPRFTWELAQLDLEAGDKAAALARIEPTLEVVPETPDQVWLLGNLLVDLGQFDRAEA